MIVLAGYGAYWAFALLGVDPYVTMIALLPVSLVVGAAIYQLLFGAPRRSRTRTRRC